MEISTSPLVKTYKLQEFWELPEPPDHSKLELIKGVLYMTPPPSGPHNEAVARIIRNLSEAIIVNGYDGQLYSARAAIWIDDDTYLEPDLMYISVELRRRMDVGHLTCADVVIEVVSLSNEVYDRTTKADTYQAMGVRELWLVYPWKQLIEVHSFEAGNNAGFFAGDILKSEVLPGLALAVARIFSA